MIEDFGEFVVRISDRQRFLKDIRAALSSEDQWQKNASVGLFPVEYSKDELVLTRDTAQRQNDAMRLAIAQKLPKYSHQLKFRRHLIKERQHQRDVAISHQNHVYTLDRLLARSSIAPSQAPAFVE